MTAHGLFSLPDDVCAAVRGRLLAELAVEYDLTREAATRVLIVGAGIAGTTLAYWLQRSGHEPTLVERAPRLREGGSLIDFWGSGFDVAEQMGIVPALLRHGCTLTAAREVAEWTRTRRSAEHHSEGSSR